jgi:catechol 2,3-dioxygenase-like lactoylglutathione lyase family enzyme
LKCQLRRKDGAVGVPARINIITLGVADLDRAAGFYEALGWERSAASNDDICWFKTAGTALGLFSRRALAEDANLPDQSSRGFGGITMAINVDSETAVDEAIGAAQRAGATVIKAPRKADWGGYSGYFADLDGHPWEIAHNPFFETGPEGLLRLP